MNTPRDHHYVPQFFLRNFATDPDRKKLTTVAKHGDRAIWAERSIESLGYERDLYVNIRNGVPVSVETTINTRIETPISQSETWAKIASGNTAALDRSDKPVLYALIRHLEARTPHYEATARELAEFAADEKSTIPFTPEEREMHAAFRANPALAKAIFNAMSASLEWTEAGFKGSGLSIYRTRLPFRSSTTPVLVVKAPPHPALRLPLPGMIPYALLLTLDRHTIASLVLADFDDAFSNIQIADDEARGINRQFVAQFAYFTHMRHLITDRENLHEDMTWAPYDLVDEGARKITYRRRAAGVLSTGQVLAER
jgi:hypothetical protein